MAKLKEYNCVVVSIYRPPDAPIPSFEEVIKAIRSWLEEEDGEVVILGDFNFPSLWAWEAIEVDLLRQRAEKREEGDQGYQTKSGMAWLELTEEFGLQQKVRENTRKDHILDLVWTNSNCPRNVRVMENVLLTDHHTVLLDYAITKPAGERVEVTNPYTTKINLYDLKKITDPEWRNINHFITEKDWGNIAKTSAEELQELIADTYEEAIIKYAKLKRVHDPNKKKKPLREIVKFLRIKKKSSQKLRRKILTEEHRTKLINTIGSCERSIRNFYQNREESREKEAWERMQENSRFFFRLAKKKARLRAPIGPFTNEKGDLIEEKVCKTLNKTYYKVFDVPDEGDSLPEDYLDSEEDLPAEEDRRL